MDRDYPIEFAKLAVNVGAKEFYLVSSMGAKASSWFLYPKTKGQAEEALKEAGLNRLIIV